MPSYLCLVHIQQLSSLAALRNGERKGKEMVTNAVCREMWTRRVAAILCVCWALSLLLQFRQKEFN